MSWSCGKRIRRKGEIWMFASWPKHCTALHRLVQRVNLKLLAQTQHENENKR
jgi:hypothetical protein